MRLFRFAELAYVSELPESWAYFGYKRGHVRVAFRAQRTKDNSEVRGHLASADIDIELPAPNSEGLIQIPEGPRQECERAIVWGANVIAMFNRVRREIRSPLGAAAVNASSEEEIQQLSNVLGTVHQPSLQLNLLASMAPSADLVSALAGRDEGISLMAEAFSHNTASGAFREYVRLFEAAFSKNFTSLGKKLAQTLDPRFGFTRTEVESWISHRHPLTHADAGMRKRLSFEEDVRSVLHRMEHAALDILFNKKDWGSWSSDRRQVWNADGWSAPPGGAGTAVFGGNSAMDVTIMDAFGVWRRGHLSMRKTAPDWLFAEAAPRANAAQVPGEQGS